MVGGWKKIKDVKNNKEVQQLGKFSVEEYNQRKVGGDAGGSIVFSEVVEAKRQVVSGLKYLLKVVVEENEIADTFDAVVVVKPWMRSKELVAFAPSTK
ncbi:Cysteine proteinase inhibitor [Thalictrum thalictroides]|uniref:Cysteine proteinase inhibitor n=1 Tax=Thalictrum thalictroides TaxID=46969 RepID=A0A7J6V2N7_THATH|nr:Cysteine proteinase inhibitor [Thalictrum thalictroides]